MANYCIADLNMRINAESTAILDSLGLFISESNREPDLDLDLVSTDFIELPEGKVIADSSIHWVQKPGQEGTNSIFATNGLGRIITRADIDDQWRHGMIRYVDFANTKPNENFEKMTAIFTDILLGMLFRYNLLFHNGIVFHASTIRYQDQGIMFTAPSGTGKSTQTRLWQERFGKQVQVLNDDTPAVRFLEDSPWVFGTPWSGSSNIHCNDRAPLSLIVILQQAEVNRVLELDQYQALTSLMPRCFLPYFSRSMLDLACNVIDKIVNVVPVIRLECRPDQEAVELVHQCLK